MPGLDSGQWCDERKQWEGEMGNKMRQRCPARRILGMLRVTDSAFTRVPHVAIVYLKNNFHQPSLID